MRSMVAEATQSRHGNAVAPSYRPEKPKAARIAPDCQIPAIDGKAFQPGDPTLALIDETFVYLGWKHDAVAAFIGVSAPLFSRAMRGVDGKKFDATWFSKLPSEFWPAFVHVISKQFRISHESRQDIVLGVIAGHLDSLNKLVRTVVVSA